MAKPWSRPRSCLPILLILLLGAIDFGRLFFGWTNLHQAVRIGANYAATHADMTADERLRYEELINGDIGELNCDLDTPIPNPTYTTSDWNAGGGSRARRLRQRHAGM